MNEQVSKLYDMGEEADRRAFLDRLFLMQEDKGTPITAMPAISKQPLDLYKLYYIVRDKGGLLEVKIYTGTWVRLLEDMLV